MLKATLTNITKLRVGMKHTYIKDSIVPVVHRNPKNKVKKSCKGKSKYEESNYNKRMQKRRNEIRQVCYNNFQIGKMSGITLTFAPDIDNKINPTDLDSTHKEFDKFIKRMNHYYDDFIYIATFSRQRNGNWHYHMVCNMDSTISGKEIEEIWKLGIVHKTIIDDERYFKNSVNYLIRNLDEIKSELKGRSGYKRSRNAVSDVVIDLSKVDEQTAGELCEKIMQSKSVWVTYKSAIDIGIMKRYVNSKTGEVSEFVDFERRLDDKLKSNGYENLTVKSTLYSIDCKFTELLPPLKVATRKALHPKCRPPP